MKIILRKDYEHLGGVGEMFDVKDGYARNFLIPNGIALVATQSNIKSVEELKRQQGRKLKKQSEDAKTLADEIEKHTVNIEMKAGDDDKLYGSVTAQMIYDKLINDGVPEFDKRKIVMKETIKSLGEHEVDVKLHSSVSAKLRVVVFKEGGSPEDVLNQTEDSQTESVPEAVSTEAQDSGNPETETIREESTSDVTES